MVDGSFYLLGPHQCCVCTSCFGSTLVQVLRKSFTDCGFSCVCMTCSGPPLVYPGQAWVIVITESSSTNHQHYIQGKTPPQITWSKAADAPTLRAICSHAALLEVYMNGLMACIYSIHLKSLFINHTMT